MPSLNRVMILGNLGAAPELRYSANGQAVTELRVATSRRYQKDGEWQEETEWHSVVCWGALAEQSARMLDKGHRVYVEGRVKTRTWDDKDGQKHWKTEIVAESAIFIDKNPALKEEDIE